MMAVVVRPWKKNPKTLAATTSAVSSGEEAYDSKSVELHVPAVESVSIYKSIYQAFPLHVDTTKSK